MGKRIGLMWLGILISLNGLTQAPPPVSYNRCATMDADSMIRAAYPEMGTLTDFESWMQEKIRQGNTALRSSAVITIPVVVHVIHNGEAIGSGSNISQAQINSQIEVLNEDFRRKLGTPGHNSHAAGADVEVEFCLAAADPLGNVLPEPGIHRVNRNTAGYITPPFGISYTNSTIKPDTYWDPNLYMNLWTADLSNDLLGFAQFPNNPGLTDLPLNSGPATSDGVVIWYRAFGRVGNLQAPYNQGRSATHEVGHWLGLRHIWGDGGCGVDDFCADTPEADSESSGCPVNSVSCGTTDMVENYMDYTNDACMNIFTQDQKTRIQTVLFNAPRRNFANSPVCSPATAPPTPAFTTDVVSICTGGAVRFFDQSGNNPTNWSWTFSGGTPATSTLQNPVVSYAAAGTYSVSLTATNSNGSASTTQNAYIVVGSSGPSVFFSEDFEGDLTGWQVSNPDNGITWAVKGVQGASSGTQAVYVHLYEYTAVGQRDGLFSPVLDLSSKRDVQLSFEYAHRRFSANEQDSLLVFVSTDGGLTYPFRVYGDAENGSGNFATNSVLASDFVPASASDWCYSGTVGAACPAIDLSAFDGKSNVSLYFEVYNAYGNNIYLDNIQLSGICAATTAVSVADVSPLSEIRIFPNPTQGQIHVRAACANKGESAWVELLSLPGQILQTWQLHPKQGQIEAELTLDKHPAGTYLLRLRVGKGWSYRRIMLE